jgi:hypothetical protein
LLGGGSQLEDPRWPPPQGTFNAPPLEKYFKIVHMKYQYHLATNFSGMLLEMFLFLSSETQDGCYSTKIIKILEID